MMQLLKSDVHGLFNAEHYTGIADIFCIAVPYNAAKVESSNWK